MISRIVQCTINPSHVDDFRTSLNTEFLPRIQAQPGFVDNIESLNPKTGEFSCVTVWKTETDVQNYDKGLFQDVVSALTPLLTSEPTVKTLPIENSSVHRVKAGKVATAA